MAAPVGKVISIRPGVVADRDGKNIPLALKSEVSVKDLIATDKTGRAQVLFDDDTTVSLGSNTRIQLEKIVASGGNPEFQAQIGQGVARFITGRIVEKNPTGFTVMTPDATIGIRGTIFIVEVSGGQTVVSVINTANHVDVNGTRVPPMHKIVMPLGTVSPMTPAEITRAETTVAARSETADSTEGTSTALAAVGQGDILPNTPLVAETLVTQLQGDQVMTIGTAMVTGTLTNDGSLSDYSGTFSFGVNLDSGAVSNATMSASGTDSSLNTFSYTAGGGVGSIAGSVLDIQGFEGSGQKNGNTARATEGSMSGNATFDANGLSVSGNYHMQVVPDIGSSIVDNGTFVGSSAP